jgi:Ser/Thr protein kinase RdoA (MazF antagonist)
LSAAGQARRLRRLALAALEQYDLKVERVTLAGHWNNTTFQVRAISPDGRRRRCLLRLSRPLFQDRRALEAEFALLDHLRRHLGPVVPHPLASRSGALVVQAGAPSIAQQRDCSLFDWLEGRFIRHHLRPVHLTATGAFLARLHQCLADFKKPPNFARKRWDRAAFFGAAKGIDADGVQRFIGRDDIKLLTQLRQRLQDIEQRWNNDPQFFGLIHADPHHGNLLFAGGQLKAIDFDECGWGYFAYDLAVILAELRRHPDWEALRCALLDGYRRQRPLDTAEEKALPALVAARLWGMAVWTAGVSDHPGNRALAPGLVRNTLAELPRWLNSP